MNIVLTKVVTHIAAGSGGHVICTIDDGKVFGWGNNSDGQLGICNSKEAPIPKIE
jgi:alpha-tubulin suppressor-like RCC1 family protein